MPLAAAEQTAAHYREEAYRLRQAAGVVVKEAVRKRLLSIADSYDALADAVLTLDRQRDNPPAQ